MVAVNTMLAGLVAGYARADTRMCNAGACAAGWEFAGPSTYVDKCKDNGSPSCLNISSAGAIQNVAMSSDDTWFVGSVNGGVWRTTTLGKPVPAWTNVLDGEPVTCSSISALHVSTLDPKRIYAGCGGSTSSEQGHDWNVVNSGSGLACTA
jgi:hypothetical protein